MTAAPSPTARLHGKVAFVTGAASGIGAATAQRLLDDGARVILTDREDGVVSRAAERAGTDQAGDARALGLACDVTSTAGVNAAMAEAIEWAGRLDVLANVAGGATSSPPIEEMDDEHWLGELDLNLTGVMRCIRAAVPHLGRGSSIVTVSSVNGLAAFGSEPYSSAKAGLSILARNLAVQLAERGIRVNVVAPGTVRTPVWEHNQAAMRRNARRIPLGRVGEPEDIAAAISFLASDDASWITGITLPVDGGMTTGPAASPAPSGAEGLDET